MTAPGPYCELHAHSCYSLLDGVPFPHELAERAAALGLPAVALTDHDAVYGLPAFVTAARRAGVHAILGAELTLDDDAHLTLLAETPAGYANLCRLITLARLNAPKGQARLPAGALAAHARGLLCLTGCRRGRVAQRLLRRDPAGAARELRALVAVFGRANVYVEVQRNLRRDDFKLSRALAELAHAHGLPPVATGNVHYLARADAALQDVLVSVQTRRPLPALRSAAAPLRPNHEYFLRSAAALHALYADLPEAVARTNEVAARCQADLPRGLQVLPAYPTPAGIPAEAYLRQLCEQALPALYPRQLKPARAWLEKELALITQLRLANYFLIVWDIVAFCRRRQILCHGRGSAANSLAARLLGISAVDPLGQGLVVERFLSVEHGGTPDIDLDIDAARRETVIQYVYDRWGRASAALTGGAAMACTYVTFRAASALRDAGFALGFKPETLEQVARQLEAGAAPELETPAGVDGPPPSEWPSEERPLSARPELAALPPEWRPLMALAEGLRGRPRHLGLHNGGLVVTGAPIAALIPVEPATLADRAVVQFDKEALEQLGLVKIDLLGLRMLSAIADTLQLVRQTRGRAVALHQLDFKDPRVYAQICSAQTIGIFQVESGAQVSVIPHLQPRCFQDLVVEVSLIRPGPLQGNMVRPYLRRRQGQEPVVYLHPRLRPALEETCGVIVFQEQVIKIARDVAGFTPGRGEVLRRALGGKDAEAALEAFRVEFLRGAEANGVPLATAHLIWRMLRGFAGYAFSKAHAAAFAVIVYWSAWLRVHFPAEYFCGLLRHAPLGTYPAHVLESEARRSGIRFLPFDVNASLALPTVQGGAIRHGLAYVKGIGAALAETLVQVRGAQPFHSLADLVRRAQLERRQAEALVLAGACDPFGERRQLLWDLAEAFEVARRPAQPALLTVPDERAALAPLLPEQKAALTFAVTGVTAGPHLVALRQDAFTRAGCLTHAQLRKMRIGARVRVGGLVADGLRRPPTAHGTAFLRLDTPDGLLDVIVPAALYAEQRAALRSAFLVIDGKLQRLTPVPTVAAEAASPLIR